MRTREKLEELEHETLAGYASKASESRGRVYPLEESPDRTCFQRDRDRIVHSKAFRRMEYKTQVFVFTEGDHYRTRLTHSMEVAQVCRAVSRSLALNGDLAEAVALAHDLGHPPFGHAGEQALNEILAESGGFNHNEQSLRVVDYLETRYPDHRGINLSYEIREGIAKHESPGAEFDTNEFKPTEAPTLEAAIVDIADEIAYNSHDIDDGLASGLFLLSDLRELSLCRPAIEESEATYPDMSEELRRYSLVRFLMRRQIHDLVKTVEVAIKSRNISTVADVRNQQDPLAGFSPEMADEIDELRLFLRDRLYRHSRIIAMANRGKNIVREVFRHFMETPGRMPLNFTSRLEVEPRSDVVRDYVAGMTDRYVELVFKSIETGAPWPIS